MNKELKNMLFISVILSFIFIVILNIHAYHAHNFIPQASKASQIINHNRLRHSSIHRASEKWPYPKIGNRQLTLVAVKSNHSILVVDNKNRHIIYNVHAQINLPAQEKPLHILNARGQQIYHIVGSRQATGKNWLGISNGDYIESPVTDLDNRHVPRNIRKAPPIENTIQVSAPDARWLQSIPKDTPLLIKEDY